VVGAAFQTFGGTDPHPAPFNKGAMPLRGITQGHPFADGNKRTGFLLAAHYLDLVGYPYPPRLPIGATVALCLRVSAGEVRDIDRIAHGLARRWGKPGAYTKSG
jgi:prophage maintenance system killer protein